MVASFISTSKRVGGDVLFHCLNGLGHYRVRRPGGKRLAVLMYHGLETDCRRSGPGFHWVTPQGCLKEIRFFQQQGYQLITAREIDELCHRKNDGSAAYLLITFDDGHANIFPHIKQWLKNEGIPVLLGICPGIVEDKAIFWWEEARARFDLMRQACIEITRANGEVSSFRKACVSEFEEAGRGIPHGELQSWLRQLRQQTEYLHREQLANSLFVHENMNWEQISELAEHPLCALASHSMYHEVATQIAAGELSRQALASIQLIEARTGQRVQHYIYPNGRLSTETDTVLADLGILHTYSVLPALNSIPAPARLNRLKGCDFETRRAWQYGNRWTRWHSRTGSAEPPTRGES